MKLALEASLSHQTALEKSYTDGSADKDVCHQA